MRTKYAQVLYEFKVMSRLGVTCTSSQHSTVGLPRLYWSGSEGEYNIMVQELLGPSLEDLFNSCRQKFTLKTTLLLADQIVTPPKHISSPA